MNTILLIALSAIIGALITLAVTALTHPPIDWLERVSKRLWRAELFDVHVETDPSIIWAGQPPWVGAAVWLHTIPDEPPPLACPDWHVWARERAGFDAEQSVLQVTIQARKDTTLLIRGLKVRQKETKSLEQIDGYILGCPVGGASLEPRRIEVNLDWGGGTGTATWLDRGGQPTQPQQLTLSSGEIEQFQIWVTTEEGWHEWWLELIVFSEGRNSVFPIRPQNNRPFITVGRRNLPGRIWSKDKWEAISEPNQEAGESGT
jgi:hypothetical protein